jgi:hypothetical protein
LVVNQFDPAADTLPCEDRNSGFAQRFHIAQDCAL